MSKELLIVRNSMELKDDILSQPTRYSMLKNHKKNFKHLVIKSKTFLTGLISTEKLWLIEKQPFASNSLIAVQGELVK